jgi:hypothetical protein
LRVPFFPVENRLEQVGDGVKGVSAVVMKSLPKWNYADYSPGLACIGVELASKNFNNLGVICKDKARLTYAISNAPD